MSAKERRTVAENRRARFDYFIEQTFEAGLALTGSEVKSLRGGRSSIAEAYVTPEGGGLVLINAHIPEFIQAGRFNHAPRRSRGLLLKKREINQLTGAVQREGMALVPLAIVFNERGLAKLVLGLGKGKKNYDKRNTERDREHNRDMSRLMRNKTLSS
jgi:SsrA-binding protein